MTAIELGSHFSIPAALVEQSNPALCAPYQKGTEVQIPGYEWREGASSAESPCMPTIEGKGAKYEACKVNETIDSRQIRYHSQAFYRDVEKIIQKYPFIHAHIIGKTVMDQPIIELTTGIGKRKVHMNASFHANEWITSALLMDWLEQFAADLIHGNERFGHSPLKLFTENSLSIVPMVNPDGVDLVLNGLPDDSSYHSKILQINHDSLNFTQWKANLLGVDLNNQFPALWEIEKERKIPKCPAPRDYPGDYPLSEPESIAMADLAERKQFDRLLCFHTQGEEIYWGYLNNEPEESGLIVKEFCILSGYAEFRNIDSHAGYRDWFMYTQKKAGFTIELGIGENPLPLDQYESIRKKGEGIFQAALYM